MTIKIRKFLASPTFIKATSGGPVTKFPTPSCDLKHLIGHQIILAYSVPMLLSFVMEGAEELLWTPSGGLKYLF